MPLTFLLLLLFFLLLPFPRLMPPDPRLRLRVHLRLRLWLRSSNSFSFSFASSSSIPNVMLRRCYQPLFSRSRFFFSGSPYAQPRIFYSPPCILRPTPSRFAIFSRHGVLPLRAQGSAKQRHRMSEHRVCVLCTSERLELLSKVEVSSRIMSGRCRDRAENPGRLVVGKTRRRRVPVSDAREEAIFSYVRERNCESSNLTP